VAGWTGHDDEPAPARRRRPAPPGSCQPIAAPGARAACAREPARHIADGGPGPETPVQADRRRPSAPERGTRAGTRAGLPAARRPGAPGPQCRAGRAGVWPENDGPAALDTHVTVPYGGFAAVPRGVRPDIWYVPRAAALPFIHLPPPRLCPHGKSDGLVNPGARARKTHRRRGLSRPDPILHHVPGRPADIRDGPDSGDRDGKAAAAGNSRLNSRNDGVSARPAPLGGARRG
jgi:hypothetical protein